MIAAALVVALTTLTVVVLRSTHGRSHVAHFLPWFAVAVASAAALATIVRSLHGSRRSTAVRRVGLWAAPLVLFGVVECLALLACRVPPS